MVIALRCSKCLKWKPPEEFRPSTVSNWAKTRHWCKECYSLSNLQPLWASDNSRKKDKIETRVFACDPGATSGVALMIDGDIAFLDEAKSLSELFSYLILLRPDVLIVESMIGNFMIDTASADKAIGVCLLYKEMRKGSCKMVYSNPSILQGKKKPRGLSPHIWSARVHALNYKE